MTTMVTTIETDVAIIGSGMGGGMLARALTEKGIQVLVLERGTRLPRESQNWDPTSVFLENRYKNAGIWRDGSNHRDFSPGVHYYVGGNTKVYGASLIRFREIDFKAYEAAEGVSPAWPFTYDQLEPYYLKAESALRVRGTAGADLTEPMRSGDYLYPALEHEKYVADFAKSLSRQGLHPYQMAMGIDLGAGGSCIRCNTCDGFPCKLGAKNDAETCGIDPALATGNAQLLEGLIITRLIHDASGKRIIKAMGRKGEDEIEINAKTFVVSAGAANSAALLLNSKSDKHPDGLSNSSGLVGRNWMVHNATFMVGLNPAKKNSSIFQKTLSFNDWYSESQAGYGLGNVQMLGKLQGPMFKASKPWIPSSILKAFAARTIDIYLESEDLPDTENRITLDSKGGIVINWVPNNMKAHYELISQARTALRKAGFPFVFKERMGIETNSHQCGTLVAGNNPQKSVLDQFCRSHDVENLFVVDSSFFPSSAAANPALTIAAQAFRVAEEGDILR
jgi:choline dehydrogenase-like flavoprotein